MCIVIGINGAVCLCKRCMKFPQLQRRKNIQNLDLISLFGNSTQNGFEKSGPKLQLNKQTNNWIRLKVKLSEFGTKTH